METEENWPASFVHHLERLVVLYGKVRAKIDEIGGDEEYPEPEVACMLRWVVQGPVRQSTARERTRFTDTGMSTRIIPLVHRALLQSETGPDDHREHILRESTGTRAALNKVDLLAAKALKSAEPELAENARRLTGGLRYVTKAIEAAEKKASSVPAASLKPQSMSNAAD
jgi:hypothetical protein